MLVNKPKPWLWGSRLETLTFKLSKLTVVTILNEPKILEAFVYVCCKIPLGGLNGLVKECVTYLSRRPGLCHSRHCSINLQVLYLHELNFAKLIKHFCSKIVKLCVFPSGKIWPVTYLLYLMLALSRGKFLLQIQLSSFRFSWWGCNLTRVPNIQDLQPISHSW